MSEHPLARVGRRVPRNVYWRGEPLFVAATAELAAEVVAALNRDAVADVVALKTVLLPFTRLSFSFDGFSCDPATLVFKGREYGQWRCDHHSQFQKMIDEARAVYSEVSDV